MIESQQIMPKTEKARSSNAKSLQSCPTLCDPIDSSPPGSPVPGILQARTLEWVAISLSNAWMWKVKVKSLSRIWLLATPWLQPTRLLHPWDSPGESTGVGCHCLLQEVALWVCYLELNMEMLSLELEIIPNGEKKREDMGTVHFYNKSGRIVWFNKIWHL